MSSPLGKYAILEKIKQASSDDDILHVLATWRDELCAASYQNGRDSILVDIQKTGQLPPNVKILTEDANAR